MTEAEYKGKIGYQKRLMKNDLIWTYFLLGFNFCLWLFVLWAIC